MRITFESLLFSRRRDEDVCTIDVVEWYPVAELALNIKSPSAGLLSARPLIEGHHELRNHFATIDTNALPLQEWAPSYRRRLDDALDVPLPRQYTHQLLRWHQGSLRNERNKDGRVFFPEVNLAGRNLSAADAVIIAKVMRPEHILDMSNNDLRDEGAIEILNGLMDTADEADEGIILKLQVRVVSRRKGNPPLQAPAMHFICPSRAGKWHHPRGGAQAGAEDEVRQSTQESHQGAVAHGFSKWSNSRAAPHFQGHGPRSEWHGQKVQGFSRAATQSLSRPLFAEVPCRRRGGPRRAAEGQPNARKSRHLEQ